jgi:hypothetical protein
MPEKPDNSKYWQELISWRFWLHTTIVDVILTGIWFGVNKLTIILPIIRDAGFLILLIAGMFCVAWYLPKLAPQYVGGETKLNPNLVHRKPSRLEHDGVLWEDGGRKGMWGTIDVIGPLCPKDFVPLGSECRDKIQSNINYDKLVSDSEYHSRLFCPECKGKYMLSKNPKTTGDSLGEVRSRFEGKRRREQEAK